MNERSDTILVTGGAGFVGSHTVRLLAGHGFVPVVLDDLSEGHREAVSSAELVEGDLGDESLLDRLFERHRFSAVLHFAGRCYVGESVRDPLRYYRENVAKAVPLLSRVVDAGVRRFVFSSSCGVYGDPRQLPMSEDHPCRPVNPYGHTKLFVERMLQGLENSHGLRWAALRYFNAAGASSDGRLGESHDPETHLIPRTLRAALGREPELTIYGTDYPTPDGTCVRDYVHVEDLARGHLAALQWLAGGQRSGAFNLGTGKGWSVREVVAAAQRVCGRPIPCREGPRRQGDPPELVADASRAERELGWRARHRNLDRTVADAWRWLRNPRYPVSR